MRLHLPELSDRPTLGPSGRIAFWLGLACVAAYVLYSLQPIHDAWWSIIDDHRKPYIYVLYHGLSLRDIAMHFWQAVDFPPLGQSLRVQPMYHVLNELELYFFGLHPQPWYLARIAYAGIAAVFAFLSFGRLLRPIPAAMLTLALLMPAYQSQVFLRLGVAECYIAPALAIAFWLCTRAEPENLSRRAAEAALMLACSVICLGSKEVMLTLMPALAFQAVRDFSTRGLRSHRFYAALLGMAFGGFIAVMLSRGLSQSPTDIYGHSLSLSERVGAIAKGGWFNAAPIYLTLALGLIAALGLRRGVSVAEKLRKGSLLVWSLILAASYLGCILMYNGVVTPESHYQFPVAIYSTVTLFFLVVLAWRFVVLNLPATDRFAPAAPYIAGVVCLWVVAIHNPPDLLHKRAEAIRLDTQAFHAKFERLLTLAKANPGTPIVFHSCGFNDVEPLDSMCRFLRGFGATNSLVLDTSVLKAKTPGNAWEAYLKKLTLSKTPQKFGFDRVTDSPGAGVAIHIDFSNPRLTNGALMNFWPMR